MFQYIRVVLLVHCMLELYVYVHLSIVSVSILVVVAALPFCALHRAFSGFQLGFLLVLLMLPAFDTVFWAAAGGSSPTS